MNGIIRNLLRYSSGNLKHIERNIISIRKSGLPLLIVSIKQQRHLQTGPGKFENEHIRSKIISSIAELKGKGSAEGISDDGVKIIQGSTLRKSSSLTRIILLGALTTIISFSIFICYNVIYLRKTVILPLYFKYNYEFGKNIFRVNNDLKKLSELIDSLNIEEYDESSYISLNSLENMINYVLFSKITANEWIRNNFVFPIDLQDFRFDQEDFVFKLKLIRNSNNILDYYNFRLKVLEISHSDSQHNFCNFEMKEKLLYIPLDRDEWKSLILSNVSPIKQVESFPSNFEIDYQKDDNDNYKSEKCITVHGKTKILTGSSILSDGHFQLEFEAVYNTQYQFLKIQHCILNEISATGKNSKAVLW